MDPADLPSDQPVSELLQPGERVELGLDGEEGQLRVTDRRVIVTDGSRLRLEVPYAGLRRVQLDLESERPAVLMVVPHLVSHRPQALTVPRANLPLAAEVIAFIGERMP